MSHDSGFRKGGQDFTHMPDRATARRSQRTKRSDRDLERRFREHEKQQESKRSEPDG